MTKPLKSAPFSLLPWVLLALAGGGASSALADGNRYLPYWAQPYPSNYAYDRRPPEVADCFAWKDVGGIFGPRRVREWVCGPSVTARD